MLMNATQSFKEPSSKTILQTKNQFVNPRQRFNKTLKISSKNYNTNQSYAHVNNNNAGNNNQMTAGGIDEQRFQLIVKNSLISPYSKQSIVASSTSNINSYANSPQTNRASLKSQQQGTFSKQRMSQQFFGYDFNSTQQDFLIESKEFIQNNRDSALKNYNHNDTIYNSKQRILPDLNNIKSQIMFSPQKQQAAQMLNRNQSQIRPSTNFEYQNNPSISIKSKVIGIRSNSLISIDDTIAATQRSFNHNPRLRKGYALKAAQKLSSQYQISQNPKNGTIQDLNIVVNKMLITTRQ
ncbi:UNKNOWN [Stylonychia lemnae]|uniref:Uncharacterized protein n=1 Tax=Stylonychia lemnae TaxID=5949 RepID=A0A078AYU2_STYLE|nr:UNKNOWN [Stylonychia lemnae]|eukprot:CDW87334.1 UNKNOWN [Stylonychia lemnae]